MPNLHPYFEEAVYAIDHGNIDKLKTLLNSYPELVSEKHPGTEEPYAGYFHEASLLHHVAFNPYREQPMPDNIVEITRLLLEAGADANALCGGGPTQPDSRHGTVIGLVVSGAQAINKGLAEGLVKVLLEYGADLEYGDKGINFFTALYHTVENKKQREAARIVYEQGHDIDMVFAAGLGLLEVVRSYVKADGSLKEGADRYFRHHRRDDLQPATDREVLQDCLLAASICNEIATMDYLLSEYNLDINAFRRWGPWLVSPLHGACWAGWLESTRFLIERGASTVLYDPEHKSTPISWAHHCGRKEVFDWFEPQDELFGLYDSMEFGKTERFKLLLGDQDPNTAVGGGEEGVLLRAAAFLGHTEIVEHLLKNGANPELRSSQGKTAMDWAKEREHKSVIDLLDQPR